LFWPGSGTLQVDGEEPIELRPGQIISLKQSARTSWVADTDFRELWIYS
jgi:hypothetical protein